VGCPNNCDYCPQAVLAKVYKGERCFTLDSFRKCIEGGEVPTSRNLTFMGAGEPFLCPDASKIILWAFHRGHGGSLSTTLRGITHADIEALKGLPFTDTIVHVPDAAGQMHLEPDDDWLDLFKHAIDAWRGHPDFVISVYGQAYPDVLPIWTASGIPVVNFGLHDRAGLVPWLPHQKRVGPVPLCGKMFCGHLFPNGDVARCCSDYGMKQVWGNLNRQTYRELYTSDAYRAYMKSLANPESDVPCRYCGDGYHSINPEDRLKTYENPC
jgi:hypothetical protein